jgi:hypothetical protein
LPFRVKAEFSEIGERLFSLFLAASRHLPTIQQKQQKQAVRLFLKEASG